MAEVPTWEVDLSSMGRLPYAILFTPGQQKGFRRDDPFYSDVEILRVPSGGLRVKITARAPNRRSAREAAVFFSVV
jgi:hypothetical protein